MARFELGSFPLLMGLCVVGCGARGPARLTSRPEVDPHVSGSPVLVVTNTSSMLSGRPGCSDAVDEVLYDDGHLLECDHGDPAHPRYRLAQVAPKGVKAFLDDLPMADFETLPASIDTEPSVLDEAYTEIRFRGAKGWKTVGVLGGFALEHPGPGKRLFQWALSLTGVRKPVPDAFREIYRRVVTFRPTSSIPFEASTITVLLSVEDDPYAEAEPWPKDWPVPPVPLRPCRSKSDSCIHVPASLRASATAVSRSTMPVRLHGRAYTVVGWSVDLPGEKVWAE